MQIAAEQKVLFARLAPDDKESVATWEARVLLPKGTYRFSARVACDQPIFRGPDCPVALKIWGGVDQQFESNRSDPQHLDFMESFTIRSQDAEEILIQCQAQSKEVSLGFQFESLVLRRLE